METIVYFIRHAPSDFSLENYHERPLSQSSTSAVSKVTEVLKGVAIDVFVASSSPRAIQTIQPLADHKGKVIETYDELRELQLRGKDVYLADDEVEKEIKRVFEIQDYKLPGGDTRKEVEERGLPVFKDLLSKYEGKTIVLGTHGIIMTLILASFDPQFNFEFWQSTSKPDIYKVVFSSGVLMSVDRLWSGSK